MPLWRYSLLELLAWLQTQRLFTAPHSNYTNSLLAAGFPCEDKHCLKLAAAAVVQGSDDGEVLW